MEPIKKILVAEDELTNSILLKRLLTKAGYSVVVANNGMDAYSHLEREQFDALLTDWMMPNMDGIELIRKVRETLTQIPLMIMITALVSEGARSYALESGADDYIAKPIDVEELLTRVKDGLAKKEQKAPLTGGENVITNDQDNLPPCVGVCVATSTGGPPTLIELFRQIPDDTFAAFYVVQHGPSWMLETFSQRLQKETKLRVSLAGNGVATEVGNVYIAPGDKHLRVEHGTYRLLLDEGPKENFVRPAADPLFRSVAAAYGKFCVGVVLTGLGRDGAQGAAHIASAHGSVIVQDPETAVAPSMPKTIIEGGISHKVTPLSGIGKLVSETIFPLAAKIKANNRKLNS